MSVLDEIRPEWDALKEAVREIAAENDKLRELLQRLLADYRYIRIRPRGMYLEHEKRMRAIEDELRELGIEVLP